MVVLTFETTGGGIPIPRFLRRADDKSVALKDAEKAGDSEAPASKANTEEKNPPDPVTTEAQSPYGDQKQTIFGKFVSGVKNVVSRKKTANPGEGADAADDKGDKEGEDKTTIDDVMAEIKGAWSSKYDPEGRTYRVERPGYEPNPGKSNVQQSMGVIPRGFGVDVQPLTELKDWMDRNGVRVDESKTDFASLTTGTSYAAGFANTMWGAPPRVWTSWPELAKNVLRYRGDQQRSVNHAKEIGKVLAHALIHTAQSQTLWVRNERQLKAMSTMVHYLTSAEDITRDGEEDDGREGQTPPNDTPTPPPVSPHPDARPENHVPVRISHQSGPITWEQIAIGVAGIAVALLAFRYGDMNITEVFGSLIKGAAALVTRPDLKQGGAGDNGQGMPPKVASQMYDALPRVLLYDENAYGVVEYATVMTREFPNSAVEFLLMTNWIAGNLHELDLVIEKLFVRKGGDGNHVAVSADMGPRPTNAEVSVTADMSPIPTNADVFVQAAILRSKYKNNADAKNTKDTTSSSAMTDIDSVIAKAKEILANPSALDATLSDNTKAVIQASPLGPLLGHPQGNAQLLQELIAWLSAIPDVFAAGELRNRRYYDSVRKIYHAMEAKKQLLSKPGRKFHQTFRDFVDAFLSSINNAEYSKQVQLKSFRPKTGMGDRNRGTLVMNTMFSQDAEEEADASMIRSDIERTVDRYEELQEILGILQRYRRIVEEAIRGDKGVGAPAQPGQAGDGKNPAPPPVTGDVDGDASKEQAAANKELLENIKEQIERVKKAM